MTGVAIIVDRIAATPRRLKFVIIKSLHVVDPAYVRGSSDRKTLVRLLIFFGRRTKFELLQAEL
jgi:hypothetical protein